MSHWFARHPILSTTLAFVVLGPLIGFVGLETFWAFTNASFRMPTLRNLTVFLMVVWLIAGPPAGLAGFAWSSIAMRMAQRARLSWIIRAVAGTIVGALCSVLVEWLVFRFRYDRQFTGCGAFAGCILAMIFPLQSWLTPIGPRIHQSAATRRQAQLICAIPPERVTFHAKGQQPQAGDLVTLDQGFTFPDGRPGGIIVSESPDGTVLWAADAYDTELELQDALPESITSNPPASSDRNA